MSPSTEFLDLALGRLGAVAPVQSRAMFGGHGIYRDGVMFAIVYRDRLYLKTDDAGRGRFEEAGMGPFEPSSRQRLTSFYELPDGVLDDPDELAEWVEEAYTAAAG